MATRERRTELRSPKKRERPDSYFRGPKKEWGRPSVPGGPGKGKDRHEKRKDQVKKTSREASLRE